MQTPLGHIADLDLDSVQTAYDILAHDKHQIAEGMVVESLFDQIIEYIPKVVGGESALLMDVETFVTRDPEDFLKLHAFVWPRTRGRGLRRYLDALSKGFNVHLVKWSSSPAGFEASTYVNGTTGDWVPLEALVEKLGHYHGERYEVTPDVRSQDRQLGAFWGYLRESHGKFLRDRVALPRLLVNWGIQPWFKSVWNIDRVLILDDQIWALEVKHKFPYGEPGPLKFGLNNGEAYLLKDLAKCGIKGLHAIVVKPYWNMNTGSSYLVSNYDVRDQALLLGMIIGKSEIAAILSRPDESSPAHTSVSGKSKPKYKPIPVTDFTPLSFLANREEIAKRICLLLRGKLNEHCTDDQLRALKIEK
ncbi:hypothetical protein LJY18_08460 [Pseudomonas sp. MMS21-TM103]|uniref:hypothetical protein n=1 Tax=Pseudomonas sp. MMS21 TM103 TaxID=2886506 RepID=UPI001EDE5AAD|nr:hypothetical protein [Pseudomonas sp. MMS21 TM103]MCG4453337.1 hypothetical protein [Pseudomonas sp. MMS21 TM103]